MVYADDVRSLSPSAEVHFCRGVIGLHPPSKDHTVSRGVVGLHPTHWGKSHRWCMRAEPLRCRGFVLMNDTLSSLLNFQDTRTPMVDGHPKEAGTEFPLPIAHIQCAIAESIESMSRIARAASFSVCSQSSQGRAAQSHSGMYLPVIRGACRPFD